MQRFKATKVASFLGIFFNLFLFVIKFIASFFTSSQAMMADAINSLGDIFSSLMTLIGNKIASKPSDDDHNLGHGKAEYIYSLLISIVIIVVAVTLFKDSIVKSDYTFSYMLIVVCIITIVIKLSLYFYTNKLSKSLNSLLLKANSKDHLYDAIITSINLLSIILTNFGISFVDGLVGVLIALWILYSGLKIFKESYDVLMDKAIDNDTKDKVLEVVKKYSEVKKITHFNATPVGYKYQISFTIFVDGKMSTYESHAIANKIERELEKFDEIYLTVIHVNPI